MDKDLNLNVTPDSNADAVSNDSRYPTGSIAIFGNAGNAAIPDRSEGIRNYRVAWDDLI